MNLQEDGYISELMTGSNEPTPDIDEMNVEEGRRPRCAKSLFKHG
jgi:hypothetical protein